MFLTKRHIPRRTFLRGAGITLALPLLDSMLPAFTPTRLTAAAPVKRFVGIWHPHGASPGYWSPLQAGKDFEFSFITKPLETYRNRVVLISGLDMPEAMATNEILQILVFSLFFGAALAYLIIGEVYSFGILVLPAAAPEPKHLLNRTDAAHPHHHSGECAGRDHENEKPHDDGRNPLGGDGCRLVRLDLRIRHLLTPCCLHSGSSRARTRWRCLWCILPFVPARTQQSRTTLVRCITYRQLRCGSGDT